MYYVKTYQECSYCTGMSLDFKCSYCEGKKIKEEFIEVGSFISENINSSSTPIQDMLKQKFNPYDYDFFEAFKDSFVRMISSPEQLQEVMSRAGKINEENPA